MVKIQVFVFLLIISYKNSLTYDDYYKPNCGHLVNERDCQKARFSFHSRRNKKNKDKNVSILLLQVFLLNALDDSGDLAKYMIECPGLLREKIKKNDKNAQNESKTSLLNNEGSEKKKGLDFFLKRLCQLELNTRELMPLDPDLKRSFSSWLNNRTNHDYRINAPVKIQNIDILNDLTYFECQYNNFDQREKSRGAIFWSNNIKKFMKSPLKIPSFWFESDSRFENIQLSTIGPKLSTLGNLNKQTKKKLAGILTNLYYERQDMMLKQLKINFSSLEEEHKLTSLENSKKNYPQNDKPKSKQGKIIQEMIETENTFYHSLDIFSTFTKNPIRIKKQKDYHENIYDLSKYEKIIFEEKNDPSFIQEKRTENPLILANDTPLEADLKDYFFHEIYKSFKKKVRRKELKYNLPELRAFSERWLKKFMNNFAQSYSRESKKDGKDIRRINEALGKIQTLREKVMTFNEKLKSSIHPEHPTDDVEKNLRKIYLSEEYRLYSLEIANYAQLKEQFDTSLQTFFGRVFRKKKLRKLLGGKVFPYKRLLKLIEKSIITPVQRIARHPLLLKDLIKEIKKTKKTKKASKTDDVQKRTLLGLKIVNEMIRFSEMSQTIKSFKKK